jgi:hypothetical protein
MSAKDEFEFGRCADCGSINYWDDIPRGQDPTCTDGYLHYCPECEAVDDIDSLKIETVHDLNAKSWFAYFADREKSKVSPFKYGKSEKEAREALLASYELPL